MAVQIELLRSWQLSRKKREEKLNGGEEGAFLAWPTTAASLPVHRSKQWKFIFPIGHISFRIRLDSMLKLIRNYINPIGFAVQRMCPSPPKAGGGGTYTLAGR